MGVIFVFDNGDFELWSEVGYEVIEDQFVLDIVVLEIDLDILETIHATRADQLANLVHFAPGDILSKHIETIFGKTVSHDWYFHKVSSNSVENISCFDKLALHL